MASAYLNDAKNNWASVVRSVAGTPPMSSEWVGPHAIVQALKPFAAAVNHAHFPTGGGMDIESVESSPERGCIEIKTAGAVYLFKPKSMHLEVIDSDVGESFVLIELDNLNQSGVYPQVYEYKGFKSEELLDLGGAEYVDRSHVDRGFYGHDENGDEMPLPGSARVVIRLLGGSILVVSKGTAWNGSPATYDGRHAKMDAAAIRSQIEHSLRTGMQIR